MKPRYFPALLLSSLTMAGVSRADIFYWDGPNDGDWSVNTNWATAPDGLTDPAGVPNGAADTAIFNTTGVTDARVINMNANRQLAGLEFNSPNTVTLQAGGTNRVLQLGAGGITTGTASKTINVGSTTSNQNISISLMADQSWLYNGTAASPTSAWGIQVKNNVSLGVAGTHTLTLGGNQNSATPQNTVNGVVSDGLGTLNIEMSGSANTRWTLAGNNTYSGTTVVKNGGLTLSHVNALGSTSAGTTVENGASVFFRATIGSMAAEAITLTGTGSGSSGALRNVNGVNTWNGAITLAGGSYIGADTGASSILTLSSTADIGRSGTGGRTATFVGGGTIDVQGDIGADIAVVRGTVGTTLMTGETKTYTGTTSISSTGNLILNTTLSGTSSVTVNGFLRGNGGSIHTGAGVTVSSTGTIAAGTSSTIQDIGTLSMGTLSLDNLATMAIDIQSGDLSHDTVQVTALNITSGAVLTVGDLGSSTMAVGSALLVIKNSGAWNGGRFTVGGVEIFDESTMFTVGSNTMQIDYDYNGVLGQGVAFVVIPEPMAPTMAALSLLAIAFRRRR